MEPSSKISIGKSLCNMIYNEQIKDAFEKENISFEAIVEAWNTKVHNFNAGGRKIYHLHDDGKKLLIIDAVFDKLYLAKTDDARSKYIKELKKLLGF